MPVKPFLLVLGALVCISAPVSVRAQDVVYKCASRRPAVYTDKPCSKHVVSTDQAAPPVEREDVRRNQTNRAIARSLRRLPDETAEEFRVRRRRVPLLPQDREECARLDTRIPVEQARMNNPDPAEVSKAQASLSHSTKRFAELHC